MLRNKDGKTLSEPISNFTNANVENLFQMLGQVEYIIRFPYPNCWDVYFWIPVSITYISPCSNCFYHFFFFRAAPTVYGGSQTRGLIRAVAASLYHSHSNVISELCLQPTPQLTPLSDPWIFNPLRDQTCILVDASQIHFHWATMGTPAFIVLNFSNYNILLKSSNYKYNIWL